MPAQQGAGEYGDPHKRETSSPTSVLSQHRRFVLDYSGTFLVFCMVNKLSLSLSCWRFNDAKGFVLVTWQRTAPRFVYTKGQGHNNPPCASCKGLQQER